MAISKRSTKGASATAPAARASFVTWLPAHVSAATSATLRTAPEGPKPAHKCHMFACCAAHGDTPRDSAALHRRFDVSVERTTSTAPVDDQMRQVNRHCAVIEVTQRVDLLRHDAQRAHRGERRRPTPRWTGRPSCSTACSASRTPEHRPGRATGAAVSGPPGGRLDRGLTALPCPRVRRTLHDNVRNV